MFTRYLNTESFSFYGLLPGLFPLELFVIITLLLKGSQKRSKFIIRTLIAICGIVMYITFAPSLNTVFFSNYSVGIVRRLGSFADFTVRFLLVVLLMFFCYKTKFSNVLFIGTIGFCVQNLSDNIVNIIYSYISTENAALKNFLFTALFLSVFALVYFLLYKLYMYKTKGDVLIKISKTQIIIFVTVTLLVANFLNMFLTGAIEDKSLKYIGRLTIILCDVLIIWLQISSLMTDRITSELKEIHGMWKKDRQSYAMGKERLNAINIQVHDMKHMLKHVDNKNADEIKKNFDAAIKDYDAIMNTGNEALDVVLNEKNEICRAENIELTVIADGESLNFMNSVDIYSLFGNILDNAIESVMKIDDPAKKNISLSVCVIGHNLVIRSDNCFCGEIKFRHGMPVTTKPDKNAHGYGTKSIGLLARKYCGVYAFTVQNETFTLEITIPKASEGEDDS